MGAPSAAAVQQFVAAVRDDLGYTIDNVTVENLLSAEWLSLHPSPYESDRPPEEWNNTAYRFLCRRHLVHIVTEYRVRSGSPLPKGRLPLSTVSQILYELWPRDSS
jgi:hypothetical protein